jgi:TolB-like protein/DNA-binding winged helix-turn-helix (wHTH) protein
MDATVTAKPPAPRLHFEPFTLDLHRAELTRGGVPVALRPKTFAMLHHLAVNAGRAVTKEELLDAIWPGVIVTDDSLSQCVAELRTALGDRGQHIIKTLPRLGYRFNNPVSAEATPSIAPPVTSTVPGGKPPTRRLAVWVSASLVALLLLAAAGLALWPQGVPLRIDTELAARRSVAVMPFTDLSEPKAPHVAYAVDHDLTTDLGRLGDIKVIARESAAALGTGADVDPKRVGRELDVRHVLTGSVRREGERLAVTVRLARTDTGALLWTDRFDYPSVADWTGRRDISARVANLLDTKVQKSVLEQALRQPLSNEAVDQWMRGSYLLAKLSTHAELLQARAHFDAALAAQADSVHALAGLAATHVCEVLYRWSKDYKASLAAGKALARRALEIDPYDLTAMKMLTGAHMFLGEIDDSMSVTRKQLQLNPNDAHSNRDLAANLMLMGRWEDALRQTDVAQSLNPLDRSHVWKCHSIRARTLVVLRRYDEAIEQARLSASADAAIVVPYLHLAAAEAQRGHLDAARQHVAEVLKRQPDYTIAKVQSGQGSTYAEFVAGIEHYYQGLRLAGLPEGPVPSGAASSGAAR